jgi:hypothetical protein
LWVVAAMLKHFLDSYCWKNGAGTDYHDWVLLATTSLLLLAAPPVDGFDMREYNTFFPTF